MAHFRPVWGAGPGLSRPAGPTVLRTAAGGFAAPPGLRPGSPGGPEKPGACGRQKREPRRGSRCKGSRFYFLRSSPSSTVGMSHSSW